jgi:hypothetical protein
MIFLLPPAAALVLTLIFLHMEARLRSKILVVALLVVAIALQFGTPYVGTWALGLVLSVGIAISLALYLAIPL